MLLLECAYIGAERSMVKLSVPAMFLFFSFLTLSTHLSIAVDRISPGQSLSGDQTIVSKEGTFELGFFRPGDSYNYHIGIWYKKLVQKTVIWVANRETPISNTSGSELKISKDGNLVLLNPSKVPVWTSKLISPVSNSSVSILLDTGNLVIQDGSNTSALLWQSFDHPTDTWIPGEYIGFNKITGESQGITSWKNSQDPAPGIFSHIIDPNGSSAFVSMWNESKPYYSTGEWNGHSFRLIPEMKLNDKISFRFVETDQRKYIRCSVADNTTIIRMVLGLSGQLKTWKWMPERQDWMLVWSTPATQCSVYSLCGSFGVCDQMSSQTCRCLQGFEPASRRDWYLNNWSGGCLRKSHLQCGNESSEHDKFLVMSNIKLPEDPQTLSIGSTEECKLACLNNCSCAAFAYTSKCLIWSGNLRNIQQLSYGDSEGQILYLRLAASELSESTGGNKTRNLIIICSVAVIFTFLCIILGLIWRRQWIKKLEMGKVVQGSLVLFKYMDLKNFTKNFSEKLGRGGFGTVFRGTLPDSTAIAVKKLESMRQGEKEFQNEVRTLGTIQHVNLVRLHGFCSEGTKRLLVYEYMLNGSLDSHLFLHTSKILDWKTRFQIIIGVARGLAYLHERCRECIIHCDIKPENILLASEFCPKLADFGMAKLVGRDFSRVLTTMRGTIGYLAPEWISGLPITSKADVYSFGMVLFEVVSGRRNTALSMDGKFDFFPVWATDKVNKDDVLVILDPLLGGVADMVELIKVCRVACWCIQDDESHRPPMGLVVQILEGILEVHMPPVPRSLSHLTGDQGKTCFFSALSSIQ